VQNVRILIKEFTGAIFFKMLMDKILKSPIFSFFADQADEGFLKSIIYWEWTTPQRRRGARSSGRLFPLEEFSRSSLLEGLIRYRAAGVSEMLYSGTLELYPAPVVLAG
jgi:hypothetical protein